MANTYTQIHIHTVFAVHNRRCLIHPSWEEELYRYMTGLLQNYDHKMLQINGMPDHIHMLFGFRPSQSLSKLIQQVKQDSSRWIKLNQFINEPFIWQSGFGAFSYSRSQVPSVIEYIKNQKAHHAKKSFNEEYIELLKAYDVEYDPRYVFKPIE